jgi:hypothetical protein
VDGIKTLWASVRGDPVFMRRVNGWLTIFWLVMIPVSIWTHWISSITYVAALTLWALVSGHWSAWQAARVEVKQEIGEERREQVAEEIVSKITDPAGAVPAEPSKRTDEAAKG